MRASVGGFVCTAMAAVVLAAPALGAGAGHARVSARLPAVATTGETVRVGVRVAGLRGSARVVVEQRSGRRWLVRASRPLRAPGGRVTLPWRAPGVASVVVVRVALVRGGRLLAAGHVRRVAVSPTAVLAPSSVVAAPSPGRAGTLRLRGPAVRAGRFVAVDIGPRTPFGLLGRVVAERSSGGETVLDVVPASLIEAVPQGTLSLGLTRTLRKATAPTAHGFRSALACSGDVHAELDGSLAVSLDPAFDLEWSWGQVESAEASVTVSGDASLTARLGAAGSCVLEPTSVATWDAPPLRFFAGPIPVVIVPRTTLYVSGRADAEAAAEASVSGFVRATAGLRYDGGVRPIGSFDEGLTYTPPALVAKAALGARVTPSVTFLLYGEAGPRFDLATGLQLDADPGRTPWWTLAAPVELSAGFELPGLDDLSVPQQTVYSTTIPLAQAQTEPPPAQSAQQPAPAHAGGGVERARIEWDTSATDVDLHVWDEHGNHASFTNPTGIPGGTLSEDDRHGFGPELFTDSAGPRTLTFGLCYFDDHGGDRTAVSVRLTDPGGAVRESTRELSRKGEGVLLGPSPAGTGFQPPAGWCDP